MYMQIEAQGVSGCLEEGVHVRFRFQSIFNGCFLSCDL